MTRKETKSLKKNYELIFTIFVVKIVSIVVQRKVIKKTKPKKKKFTFERLFVHKTILKTIPKALRRRDGKKIKI